tara:strand:- start:495 stop:1445 length:951 start_codon:yes stop_codon:yes gene_type:complete
LTFIYLFIFKEKKIDKIILYPILFLFVFGLINYLPKLYFGYSFKDFYTATILYQASSSKGPVMSINFIYFLILTLILPLFLKAIYFSNFKNFIIKRFDYFIIAIFLLISISKYLYFSDGTGGRYLLFLYIPLIYFIIYFSEYIKINKIIIALYFLISILVHGKNLAPPILKNLVFHNCFINFYCDAPSYANLFKGTVEYLNKNKNKKYYYVDINAWILIITNSDYYGVVNNNYIYSCKRGNCVDSIDKNEPWVTDGLLNAHNKFLNGEFGNMIIHDWLYIRNPEQLSKYWGEIVKHQVNLKKLDHFYLLEINKNNK